MPVKAYWYLRITPLLGPLPRPWSPPTGCPTRIHAGGGSIPVAALFDEMLQLPVVLMGFGLTDDGLHAPNEKFSLAQFSRGMAMVADFIGRLRR